MTLTTYSIILAIIILLLLILYLNNKTDVFESKYAYGTRKDTINTWVLLILFFMSSVIFAELFLFILPNQSLELREYNGLGLASLIAYFIYIKYKKSKNEPVPSNYITIYILCIIYFIFLVFQSIIGIEEFVPGFFILVLDILVAFFLLFIYAWWLSIKKTGVEERTYVNGKQEGVSKEYYEDGKIHWERSFLNGKLHGISKEYDENGNLINENNYAKGKLDGICKEYCCDGKVNWEKNYKNGKACETYRYSYYSSGELHSTFSLKNPKRDGGYWRYERDGISKWYDKNGNRINEKNYVKDKLEGISTEYYESGKLKFEDTYKNDEIIHRNGYYPNGKLKFEYSFKNGKQHGIAKEYDENGKIKFEGYL